MEERETANGAGTGVNTQRANTRQRKIPAAPRPIVHLARRLREQHPQILGRELPPNLDTLPGVASTAPCPSDTISK